MLLLLNSLGLHISPMLTLNWKLLVTWFHLDARKSGGQEIQSLTGSHLPVTNGRRSMNCGGRLDVPTMGVTGISIASPLCKVHLLPFQMPYAPQIQLKNSR